MNPTWGDPQFTEFYRSEFGRVVSAVRGQLGADAEDVAQEAFVVAADRWDSVANLDVPAAWVRFVALRMARRRAAREHRRAAIERSQAIIEPEARPDLDVAAAILQLPDRHAAAVWLHHFEDRPIAQVAERIGCSEAAAKVLLFRARRLLAERLTGLTGEWVSERSWSPDAIAAHLRRIGAGHHIGPILDEDLDGRGGRWELAIADGAYRLHRDDGFRLDHGSSRVTKDRFELRPILNTGRAAYRPVVDGDRLHLRLIDTTIPPTRGVPDEIWINLFLEAGAFVRTRQERTGL
ncbi:MAG: hypothetical protein EPO00_08535 [Chloroflexota bacterium]|nr:MAG: hypothetical protein EPO00_08535 [Chloroflexota bacterium]